MTTTAELTAAVYRSAQAGYRRILGYEGKKLTLAQQFYGRQDVKEWAQSQIEKLEQKAKEIENG